MQASGTGTVGFRTSGWRAWVGAAVASIGLLGRLWALDPVPERLVVLTFDDSVSSHHRVVAPLLKRLGFGATFFITEGFSFLSNKVDYLTWAQIASLDRDGFEIGNHTRDHLGFGGDTLGRMREQIEHIQNRCAEHGIRRPVSFGYPGNALHAGAPAILKELGFRFARRGGTPEHPYEWGRGTAYEPGVDHPLLIPSAGDARPDWTLEDFRRAVDVATNGRIAVVQFHGVPDRDHPWVHTEPKQFEAFMTYLKDGGFTVIALRDLARFVDASVGPADPFSVIRRRQAGRREVMLEGNVRGRNGQRLACTLSLQSAEGAWFFPKSAALTGSAVRRAEGERATGLRRAPVVALSAHPFRVELVPGRYTVEIDGGAGYEPLSMPIDVAEGVGQITFQLNPR